MKKLLKKLKPKLLIPIVLLAGVVVGGYFLLSGGDDEQEAKAPPPAPTATTAPEETTTPTETATTPAEPAIKPKGVTQAIDRGRAQGDAALAQASGTVKHPVAVRVRVSAAPKQPVRVNWDVVCFKSGGASTGNGSYVVTPPDTRAIKLPVVNPRYCNATAGAQLQEDGRIKVVLIGDR